MASKGRYLWRVMCGYVGRARPGNLPARERIACRAMWPQTRQDGRRRSPSPLSVRKYWLEFYLTSGRKVEPTRAWFSFPGRPNVRTSIYVTLLSEVTETKTQNGNRNRKLYVKNTAPRPTCLQKLNQPPKHTTLPGSLPRFWRNAGFRTAAAGTCCKCCSLTPLEFTRSTFWHIKAVMCWPLPPWWLRRPRG